MARLFPIVIATSIIGATCIIGNILGQGKVLGQEKGAEEKDTKSSTKAIDFAMKEDRLIFSVEGKSIGEYVFRDEKILRPYFSSLKTLGGTQVTRNHPPVAGTDATDHDSMHPGLWLAFGDINGHDFWRNKGSIRHTRFIVSPRAENRGVLFTSESSLIGSDGEGIGMLVLDVSIGLRETGWTLLLEAILQPGASDLILGDQEEMGFGARVATPLTEKKGGRILNSRGITGASKTWGQPADWCDYSGSFEGKEAGITLFASPKPLRQSWWHNRDYGLIVANPFGRKAMKQGEPNQTRVAKGEELRLKFGAFIHDQGVSNTQEILQGIVPLSDLRSTTP